MAVQHLRAFHMSSAYHSDTRKDTDRREEFGADTKLPDQSSWTRSPSFTGKRPAFPQGIHADEMSPAADYPKHDEQQRLSYHGLDAVLSPTQRKRHRGDSDMSMSGNGVASPLPYGSVRITSTSIRALVHDDSGDFDGRQRQSMTFDDMEYSGRDSWAASSSRGSGRDSDLWDRNSSPHADEEQDDDSSRASIGNASRNITFSMLQTHFSKPLKDAANHFGVCTTLLKKICRKNGILSWPYRQIIGLEKSIASMEQQVHYFDGEQRRQYADQLRKLQIKLDAYIRTGQAPGEEELTAALQAQNAAAQPGFSSAPASQNPQLREEYYQPSQQGYYYPPQGSVMASAVTLDAEEPKAHFPPHASSSMYPEQAYDQRYGAYPAAPAFSQRPLPSLASLLNPASQPQPPHTGYSGGELRRDDYPYDHQWRS